MGPQSPVAQPCSLSADTARQALRASAVNAGVNWRGGRALPAAQEPGGCTWTQRFTRQGRQRRSADRPLQEMQQRPAKLRRRSMSAVEHLYGGWDPPLPGAAALAAIAGRLSEFVIEHYGDSARPS